MTAAAVVLLGRWYALGPEDRAFDPDDPAWAVHRIVAEDHALPGCVTVENPAGQRFPLARAFAERIALDEDPHAFAARMGERTRRTGTAAGP